MIFSRKEIGLQDKSIRVIDAFAFLPIHIERPSRGLLWGEFYGKVYEYYNGAWHFMGILHRGFDHAQFENNTGHLKYVMWYYPNKATRIWYFTRLILVILFWVTLIMGSILLLHKYF